MIFIRLNKTTITLFLKILYLEKVAKALLTEEQEVQLQLSKSFSIKEAKKARKKLQYIDKVLERCQNKRESKKAENGSKVSDSIKSNEEVDEANCC